MYMPSTGRFDRLDPYAGNISDPQSLNKYLYGHSNPIANTDPSGEFIVSFSIGFAMSLTHRAFKDVKDLGVLAKISLTALNIGRFAVLLGSIPESSAYFSFYTQWRRQEEKDALTGVGGLNVEQNLKNTATEIHQWFSSKNRQQQEEVLRKIHDLKGWDVTPLPEFTDGQRNAFAAGLDNWATRTVTVGNEVHYGHEVNYFFWGALNASAAKNGHTKSRSTMMNWVTAYRRFLGDAVYSGYDYQEHDGTLAGRVKWAEAGWDFIHDERFEIPSAVRVENATANQNNYTGQFTVFIGGDEILRR